MASLASHTSHSVTASLNPPGRNANPNSEAADPKSLKHLELLHRNQTAFAVERFRFSEAGLQRRFGLLVHCPTVL